MARNRLAVTLWDGTEHTVTTNVTDRLDFEQLLRRHKSWGGLEDNFIRMQLYMGWSALKREDPAFTQPFAEFMSGPHAALDVANPQNDDDDEEDGEDNGLGEGGSPAAPTSSPSPSDSIFTSLPGSGAVMTAPTPPTGPQPSI